MSLPWTVDAGLLFVLSVPIVMKYRILPTEGTPYWLFGILFLLLALNIFISLFPTAVSKYVAVGRAKLIITWLVIAIVIGGTTVTAIADRHRVAPAWTVHDIILQQEAAMRYLIHGKNPYKETYFGTPVESFHYDELGKPAVNPALYHFVMPPWYLLFPFFFYTPANKLFGYFDGRMVLLFCLAGTLLLLGRFIKNEKLKLLAMALVALSPGVADYFIEGRSDAFALFWLLAALHFLEKKRFLISSVIFGLAMISKQTVWFALPFYAVAVWKMTKETLAASFRPLLVAAIVAFVLTFPFLVWDWRAFIDSVILYLSGGTTHGYPISGYGLGMVLHDLGLIKDLHGYFPFVLFQVVFGIPIAIAGLRFLVKKPVMSRLLFGYAATLLVVWYFSRYLNNSHLGYISTVFILAILKDWDEKAIT